MDIQIGEEKDKSSAVAEMVNIVESVQNDLESGRKGVKSV